MGDMGGGPSEPLRPLWIRHWSLDFCFQICSEPYFPIGYITYIDKFSSHSVKVQLRNRFTVRNMKEIPASTQQYQLRHFTLIMCLL